MSNLSVQVLRTEIDIQLADKETATALMATTFKGLSLPSMKQAILEGMMRGFTFGEFLNKDIYAVPFSSGYALVTSIDYSRKVANRAGLAGKDEPVFNEDGSCSVTVYKIVEGQRCPFTAKVFMEEYFKKGSNGKPSQWEMRPKAMLAKVAEMHALRMAFPEELSKAYVEEEKATSEPVKVIDFLAIEKKFSEAKTEEELKAMYMELTTEEKNDKSVIEMAKVRKQKILDGDITYEAE